MVSHSGMPFILTLSYYFRYFHNTIFSLIPYISIYNLEGLFPDMPDGFVHRKELSKKPMSILSMYSTDLDCGNATVLL